VPRYFSFIKIFKLKFFVHLLTFKIARKGYVYNYNSYLFVANAKNDKWMKAHEKFKFCNLLGSINNLI